MASNLEIFSYSNGHSPHRSCFCHFLSLAASTTPSTRGERSTSSPWRQSRAWAQPPSTGLPEGAFKPTMVVFLGHFPTGWRGKCHLFAGVKGAFSGPHMMDGRPSVVLEQQQREVLITPLYLQGPHYTAYCISWTVPNPPTQMPKNHTQSIM